MSVRWPWKGLDPSRQQYTLVCDCTQLACDEQSFVMGYYNTPEEAVRARVLHELGHESRFGNLGQKYEILDHPDWRYSEQGRCDHAQAECWANLDDYDDGPGIVYPRTTP